MMNEESPNIGGSFEDWLKEEGLYEDATHHAVKSVLAWQVGQFMHLHGLTKTAMARRMQTSRAALDRLLDPRNESVTLKTMQSAARAVGARLEVNLSFDRDAA